MLGIPAPPELTDNICEEMADSLVMFIQIGNHLKIDERLQEMVVQKTQRLDIRINNEIIALR